MKRFLSLLLVMIMVLSVGLTGCKKETTLKKEEPTFKKGNLLYDLGAKSIEDIEKVEFLHTEYQGDYEEKIAITEKEDIEFFCNYTYSSDYPSDKLHELLVYPSNTVYITIDGVEYRLHLGKDGSLTTMIGDNMTKTQTYKAAKDKGITDTVWEDLIEKYQKKCSFCGKKVIAGTLYCVWCGQEYELEDVR